MGLVSIVLCCLLSVVCCLLSVVCCLLLLSIAIYRGFHLKRSALRLPEASGKRLQTRGSDFSILHVGESPVAGVGVADIRQGLTHQVIRKLTQDRGVEFDWEILAKNGARVSRVVYFI